MDILLNFKMPIDPGFLPVWMRLPNMSKDAVLAIRRVDDGQMLAPVMASYGSNLEFQRTYLQQKGLFMQVVQTACGNLIQGRLQRLLVFLLDCALVPSLRMHTGCWGTVLRPFMLRWRCHALLCSSMPLLGLMTFHCQQQGLCRLC